MDLAAAVAAAAAAFQWVDPVELHSYAVKKPDQHGVADAAVAVVAACEYLQGGWVVAAARGAAAAACDLCREEQQQTQHYLAAGSCC